MINEPHRDPKLPPLPKVRQMAMLVEDRNYSQCDLYAQIILEHLPHDPHANVLVAWVANHFGIHSKRDYFLAQVEPQSTDIHIIARDLSIDPAAIFEPTELVPQKEDGALSNGKQKIHVIKAWGYGLGAEMAALMGQLLLADILDRKPLIHWGSNCLFRRDDGRSAFTDYFKPINDLHLDELELEDGDVYPPKWNSSNIAAENIQKTKGQYSKLSALYFFNRPERVTVADYYAGVVNVQPWIPEGHILFGRSVDEIQQYLMQQYLQPLDVVVDQANTFIEQNLRKPYLAVHARGSDKDEGYRKMTSVPKRKLLMAQQRIAAMPADTQLFLMTDDQHLLKNYQEAFGDRLFTTDCQRADGEVGIHYVSTIDKTAAGRELLVDMLIAGQAEEFIGLGLSNPSTLLRYYTKFPEGKYTLFGEDRLLRLNTHIYKTISVVNKKPA